MPAGCQDISKPYLQGLLGHFSLGLFALGLYSWRPTKVSKSMDTLWLVRCPLYLNCVGAIVAAKGDVVELRVLPEVPETGRNVGLEVIPAEKRQLPL